ncbi:MAG: DUF1015 domain-containing protein [Bradymonadia bacterium]
MRIKPFKGWRPPDARAHEVASVPYDVVNTEEARTLAEGKPHSMLHVIRPEIDLPAEIDAHGTEAYAQAQSAFEGLIADGALVQDDAPGFYLYAQTMGDHHQVGLVCLAHTEDYWAGRIKKHEHTRPDKEDDRMRHIEAVGAHLGPVFLAYPKSEEVDALISEIVATAPSVDYVAEDDVRHTLWPVFEDEAVAALGRAFNQVPAFYVADGHHRTAAAGRLGRAHPGTAAEWFLTVLFPDDQLQILDYNRVVADLNGHEHFLSVLLETGNFLVTPLGQAEAPSARHVFSMCLGGDWYSVRPSKPDQLIDESDPVASLDVSVLQDHILEPLLGIDDPRTNTRISFVGGIRGLASLESAVKGQKAVAFALYPTSLGELMRIADAGEIMPPKSTWFEPKLRTGLVVHRWRD